MTVLACWAFGLASPPVFMLTICRSRGERPWSEPFYRRWASGAGLAAVLSLIWDRNEALVWAASCALAIALWWLSRRKGKRKALRALGGKARARLAAMVKNMPGPGPVLRPVPQGAG